MERAYRTSFSGVALRTDPEAETRAQQLGARAYTDGREIGFAPGVFQPDTPAGLFTIAHEFAHVVQSRGGTPAAPTRQTATLGGGSLLRQAAAPAPSASQQDPIEQDADQAAEQVVEGFSPDVADASIDTNAPRLEEAQKIRTDLARGTYFAAKTKGGGYIFGFNAQDVRDWSDSKSEFFSRYVHHLFPAATTDDIAACQKDQAPFWSQPLDRAKLDKQRIVRLSVNPNLDHDTQAWFKKNRPLVASQTTPPAGIFDTPQPGKAAKLEDPNTIRATGTSTGAESQGLLSVQQFYDYLKQKFPDHPMFKDRAAKLEDLLAYLGQRGQTPAGTIKQLDQVPAAQWKKFLDAWQAGKLADGKEVEGGVASTTEPVYRFEPKAVLALYPKVEKYITGAEIRAVVEFKFNDFDNAMINVFPNKASFTWSIRNSSGQELNSGISFGGRGDIDHTFKAPDPGVYSVNVRVTSEHFSTSIFEPPAQSFTAVTESARDAEVFNKELVGGGNSQPLEVRDGNLKVKAGAPTATIENELADLDDKLKLIDQMLASKQINEDQATDYRKIVNDRKSAMAGKKDLMGSGRTYRAYGTFVARETSESVRLNLIVRGNLNKQEDGTGTYTINLLDTSLPQEEAPTHSGTAQVNTAADGWMLMAEHTALTGLKEDWRSNNSYPDGTLHVVVELSDGSLWNDTINTANNSKVAHKYLGVGALVLGTGVLLASAFTGETTAPAGILLIEVGSTAAAGVTLAGYAAATLTLADLALKVDERHNQKTLHADRESAVDALTVVTTIAGFGGVSKLAQAGGIAKATAEGGLLVTSTGLGVAQGFLMSKDMLDSLKRIEFDYNARKSQAKTDDERAALDKQMAQDQARVVGNFALSGGFLLVATAHGISQIKARGFLKLGGKGSLPEYTVSERIKGVGEKLNPTEIRQTLDTDPTIDNQERAYLEEAYVESNKQPADRAKTDPAEPKPVQSNPPNKPADPTPVDPNAKTPAKPTQDPSATPARRSPPPLPGSDVGLTAVELSKPEAYSAYNRWIALDALREVGIYIDPASGEYIVVQGTGGKNPSVPIDEVYRGDATMKRVWVLVEHYHPIDNPSARFASPEDFYAMMFYQTTGHLPPGPVTTNIRWTDPVSKIDFLTEIGYRPNDPKPYFMKFREVNGVETEWTMAGEPWKPNSEFEIKLAQRGVPTRNAIKAAEAQNAPAPTTERIPQTSGQPQTQPPVPPPQETQVKPPVQTPTPEVHQAPTPQQPPAQTPGKAPGRPPEQAPEKVPGQKPAATTTPVTPPVHDEVINVEDSDIIEIIPDPVNPSGAPKVVAAKGKPKPPAATPAAATTPGAATPTPAAGAPGTPAAAAKPAVTAAPASEAAIDDAIRQTAKLKGMSRVLGRLKETLVPDLFPTKQKYLEFMQHDPATAAARLQERMAVRETRAQESAGRGPTTPKQTDFAHYTAPPEANLTREEALGETPNRNSTTGKAVIDRMRKEGRINDANGTYFLPQDGKWHPIAGADMGHVTDAVRWWNDEGYLYGTRSETVRDWMKNSDNYELQPPEFNQREGALLGAKMRGMGLGYRRAHPEPISTDIVKGSKP